MKNYLSPILFTVFIFLNGITTLSQEVSNIQFEQIEKKIHIYYDLEGDQEYIIKVFCKTGNNTIWGDPLVYVTGDVGENQKSGQKKRIIWDVLRETEKLQGDIQFKIEGFYTSFSGQSGKFIDSRDGKIYKWVLIGNQVWMGENLNVGKMINSNQKPSNNRIIEKYCYNNDLTNCEIYGALYQWNELMNYVRQERTRGICPEGFHIPDQSDWKILEQYLGGSRIAGGKLKEKGIAHWKSPNTGATDQFGFSAKPNGNGNAEGKFNYIGIYSFFFLSTEESYTKPLYRSIDWDRIWIYHNTTKKNMSLGVRCLKN